MDSIVLIPPNHEQSTPSFHIVGSLAHDFLEFLKGEGVTIWQSPKAVGSDDRKIVEVEVQSETPVDKLEDLRQRFLANI